MTKIYKTFNCDAFYPLKTWNNVIGRFKELPVSDDIPYPLGQIVKDDGKVDISFHVFELSGSWYSMKFILSTTLIRIIVRYLLHPKS